MTLSAPLQELVEKAQRRPMGDSWTYATPREFADALSKSIVAKCADYVFQSEEVTVGQGYMLRKRMRQHFGLDEWTNEF